MDEGWRGVLSRKLVWSLGTAKAGRSLQTFVPFHSKFAVGGPPTSILSHQNKPESRKSQCGFFISEAFMGNVGLIVHCLQSVLILKSRSLCPA